jgi:hypothetical protein
MSFSIFFIRNELHVAQAAFLVFVVYVQFSPKTSKMGHSSPKSCQSVPISPKQYKQDPLQPQKLPISPKQYKQTPSATVLSILMTWGTYIYMGSKSCIMHLGKDIVQ